MTEMRGEVESNEARSWCPGFPASVAGETDSSSKVVSGCGAPGSLGSGKYDQVN